MITRKLTKLVLICGLATTALGTGAVMAKGGMPHGKGMPEARFLLSEHGAAKLDLTQQQQKELKAAFEAQKAQMKAMRGNKEAQRDTFKAQMETLLAKATFDESAAQEIIDLRKAKVEVFAMQKLKMEHTVWQILNVEQREKYTKMKKRFAKKMKDKGHRKGWHGGKNADEKAEG